MLDFKVAPTISADDLEEVLRRSGINVCDFVCLFWEGDFGNDSYKKLYLDDLDNYSAEGDEEEVLKRNVLKFLRKNIPSQFNYILVDVSW